MGNSLERKVDLIMGALGIPYFDTGIIYYRLTGDVIMKTKAEGYFFKAYEQLRSNSKYGFEVIYTDGRKEKL